MYKDIKIIRNAAFSGQRGSWNFCFGGQGAMIFPAIK